MKVSLLEPFICRFCFLFSIFYHHFSVHVFDFYHFEPRREVMTLYARWKFGDGCGLRHPRAARSPTPMRAKRILFFDICCHHVSR